MLSKPGMRGKKTVWVVKTPVLVASVPLFCCNAFSWPRLSIAFGPLITRIQPVFEYLISRIAVQMNNTVIISSTYSYISTLVINQVSYAHGQPQGCPCDGVRRLRFQSVERLPSCGASGCCFVVEPSTNHQPPEWWLIDDNWPMIHYQLIHRLIPNKVYNSESSAFVINQSSTTIDLRMTMDHIIKEINLYSSARKFISWTIHQPSTTLFSNGET